MKVLQSRLQFTALVVVAWTSAQSAFAQHCNATQDYLDLNNGTILDLRTGLQWQVCRVGQTWKDGACTGTPKLANFADLLTVASQDRYLGFSDWRVPSRSDYVDIGASEPRLERNWPLTTKRCRGITWTEASDRDNPRDLPEWTSTPTYAVTVWNDPDKPAINSTVGGFVRLVRSAPHFGFNTAESLQNAVRMLQQQLPGTVVWRTSYQPQGVEKVFDDRRGLLMPVIATLYEDDLRAIEVAITPVFSEVQPTAEIPKLTKDEFETSAQFESRQRAAEDAVRARLAQDSATFERRSRKANQTRDEAIAKLRQEREDPARIKARVERLIPRALAAVFGNPELRGITYDADNQVFSARVVGSKGGFQQSVQVPAALSDAPRLKQDLLAGKIAPLLLVQMPSLEASWTLEENAALRTRRFEAATTVSELEDLIKEYPNSAEVSTARTRVFKVAKGSKELAAAIERNRSWPEATAANKLLQDAQDDEFRRARSEDRSWSYDKFIENFGGPDPKKLVQQAQKARANAKDREDRQAREAQAQWERDRPAREARERAQNLCRAQVNTCIASCPRAWSDTFKSYSDFPDYSCKSRCESVSCN